MRPYPYALATAALWLVLHAKAVLAATCPSGVTAPDVTTLMVSSSKPATDAWVVLPDCSSVKTISLVDGRLNVWEEDLERIVSIPSETMLIACTKCKLSQGVDVRDAKKLTFFTATYFSDGLSQNLKLPNSLQILNLLLGPVDSASLRIPETVTSLNIVSAGISSLAKLPAGLKSLAPSLPDSTSPYRQSSSVYMKNTRC